jgi:hypothetical protein
MSNTRKNNNVALLKMGCDNNELNHRIRFISNTEITYKGKPCTMCCDFMTCTPFYLTKSKKTVRGVENSALTLDFQYTDETGCSRAVVLPEALKNKLEYLEGKYSHYLKYSYKNILTIINYFYKTKFNNVVLLDSNYIINFDYDTFNSDIFFKQENINYILDMYDKAIKFQELASFKIKMLKDGSKYDNSSYYYNGNLFTVLIHWNCYNDILEFDLNNFIDSIDKMKDYEIPVEKIKNGRIEKGCNSDKLY